MESASDWLRPQYIWIIVGFILLLVEFAIPGLITVFFGLGALAVGIICWFVDVSLNTQLLIFIVCSVLLLVSLRKSFKRLFEGRFDAKKLDTGELDDFIGQKAVVTKEITPGKIGKVEFHGSYWEAEASETIPEGSSVEIIDKKNITLIVRHL